MYEDIYFLDSKEALRVAAEHNRWGVDVAYNLQACYYDGQKIESDLPNLFHLPIENLLEGLVYGRERIPSQIDFSGLDISSKVKMEILTHFNITMEQAKQYRVQINLKYLNEIKNFKPDFSEPLRFYLMANDQTTVMQFVSKNIADVLKDMGYEVLYDLYRGTEDATCFKKIYELKPHVTININHLNNKFLSDDVFNFVWFQDYMEILKNDENIKLRERDFIFHLIKDFADFLRIKGIESKYQPFCIDETRFKKREDIKKEKKIVFIGSSYSFRIEKLKNDSSFNEVFADALKIFEEKSCLKNLEHNDSDIRYLMNKYNKSEQYIADIYAYLTRDYCVEKLCSIETDYQIEVYGYGWEKNDKVKSYFKGKVEYGEDISKIYNSATYGFCPGGYVLMQRTLECACSETVPLVLDTRADLDSEYDKKLEESIEFFHIKDLEEILKKPLPKDKRYDYAKEQHSYKHLVKRYLNIIKERVSG